MPGRVGLYDLDAVIGRAVIDDQDFGEWAILASCGVEELFDELGLVAAGDDHRN
jgi:hypothetical protein